MSERDALLGRTLAERYRIDALIARGGMARVYRARDERLERDVAIKVLSDPYAGDPAFVDRFLGEARAAASITHPSLVHVYDSGSDDGDHFIVMELLDRYRTLRSVLDERGRLPADEVVQIGGEILAGLRAVHERDLVHCDVKSSNVMLAPGSAAKLIDFGIATAPHAGIEGDTSIGSLPFMSPEQLHGEALTPASDLFSLGAVLYEALTGRSPYPGSTPAEVSAAHQRGDVQPPSRFAPGIPERLDAVILQALRRDPAARFHSAQAMAVALDSASREDEAHDAGDETRVIATGYVPPPVPRPPPVERRPRPRRTALRPGRRLAPAIGTVLVLVAAAAVVLFVVVPLIQLGRGASPQPSPSASAVATPAPAPGTTVTVPNLIGMPTADAVAAARAARLDWTVHCAENAEQPEGIIDQEPPAGAQVARGSPFNLYSARISDCR
ncbi:MAG TPA: serine/threonine-protein kinase [Candidatus Limnocylindria bacterium]|nr:serine/threonine-protein kinase [Candidatus Limnocylindria bacterium]